MTSSKNYTIGLVFAVSLLVAANVRADIVSNPNAIQLGMVNYFKDQGTYSGYVQVSDWDFVSVGKLTGGNGYSQWGFNMAHADGTTTGSIRATGFNGNGGSGNLGAGLAGNGTAWMNHNSANTVTLSFQTDFSGEGPFVDSFYIALEPHSSWSAAMTFNVTVSYWDTNLNKIVSESVKNVLYTNDPFFGFVLDEGAYLSSITFQSTGTNNNGYKISGMGFGDTGLPPVGEGNITTATPEPATLAVLGLGLAGLGLVARRRK